MTGSIKERLYSGAMFYVPPLLICGMFLAYYSNPAGPRPLLQDESLGVNQLTLFFWVFALTGAGFLTLNRPSLAERSCYFTFFVIAVYGWGEETNWGQAWFGYSLIGELLDPSGGIGSIHEYVDINQNVDLEIYGVLASIFILLLWSVNRNKLPLKFVSWQFILPVLLALLLLIPVPGFASREITEALVAWTILGVIAGECIQINNLQRISAPTLLLSTYLVTAVLFLGIYRLQHTENHFNMQQRVYQSLVAAMVTDRVSEFKSILSEGGAYRIDGKDYNLFKEAVRLKKTDFVAALQTAGVRAENYTDRPENILHLAVRLKAIEVLKLLLLEPGSSVSLLDKDGRSAIDYAGDDPELLKLLNAHPTAGGYIPVRQKNVEAIPEKAVNKTRLRLKGKPEGVWERRGTVIYLTEAKVSVRNAGDTDALNAEVILKIPGGQTRKMNGPHSIPGYQVVEYILKERINIKQFGELKVEFNCQNCRK